MKILFEIVEFHLCEFPHAHGIFEIFDGLCVACIYVVVEFASRYLGFDGRDVGFALFDCLLGFLNLFSGTFDSFFTFALLGVCEFACGLWLVGCLRLFFRFFCGCGLGLGAALELLERCKSFFIEEFVDAAEAYRDFPTTELI